MNSGLIIFSLVALGLCLVVVTLLGLAMVRRRDAQDISFDVQVYRDQLKEIERDLARGVLSAEDAERVRVEVSRRLLDADKATAQENVDAGALWVPIAFGVTVTLAGGILYVLLGWPGYGDQPLKARVTAAETRLETRPSQAAFEAENVPPYVAPLGADPDFLALVDKLRQAVRENPNDIEGQMLLARNESGLGNFPAAHRAFARVIELRGAAAGAADYAVYLDMLVTAAIGYVSPEAEAVALRILQLEPKNGTARYYLGLMYMQHARPDLALPIWDGLLRESTMDEPWTQAILAQIEQVVRDAGAVRYQVPQIAGAATPGLPGPSQDDIEAAGEMEAEDRQAMIRGMVEGLAERLATEGGSPDEWARLVNALGVLGETDRARAIWAEAQTVFAENPQGLAAIRSAAQAIGIEN